MSGVWKKLGWSLAGLLLLGCGRGVMPPSREAGVFAKYRDAFVTYAGKYGVDSMGADTFPIEFGTPTEDSAVAECRVDLVHGKRIVVRESSWKGYSEDSKQSLLLHELGHCVLRRVHRSDVVINPTKSPTAVLPPNEAPASLMNPKFVPGDTYRAYQEFYLKELFSAEFRPSLQP